MCNIWVRGNHSKDGHKVGKGLSLINSTEKEEINDAIRYTSRHDVTCFVQRCRTDSGAQTVLVKLNVLRDLSPEPAIPVSFVIESV
jgi:hypothetical protein